MKQYYLGIDNGGTVTKAALYDEVGREVALHAQPANIVMPQKNFVERDCSELLQSVRNCIVGVLKESGIPATKIAGISVSCHGKGLYLLGKDNQLVYNGIISSDSRAQEIVRALKEEGITKKLYPISYQQLWTGHPASLLVWFSKYHPEVLENTKHIFMGHDYIRYYLTGEAHAEITNMSGSALVDVRHKNYSDDILSLLKLGVIKEKLPPLIESTQQCGVITKTVEGETGLVAGTPVYAGFFDVVASAISAGLIHNKEINCVMGTWAISSCLSDTIITSNYPHIWGNYCLENKYFAHEGSPTSASNLEWFVKEFIGTDKDVFVKCNALVREANNDKGLLFFPFLYSSNMSDTMGSSFVGMRSYHAKADVLKAIYEGIVFAHAMHLNCLYPLVEETQQITLVGGPTKSEIWMQIYSDITQQKVTTLECKEAGCKGAALAAMVGSNLYDNFEQAVENTVVQKQVFLPSKENKQFYQDKYEYYKSIGNLIAQHEAV